jgi:hypothetical protein
VPDESQERDVCTTPPTQDSGLRCLRCNYNLTGVADNRCPECGTTFERRHIEAILAGAPTPIPIWEDPGVSLPIRFIRMCLATWFTPWRVGRTFPSRYGLNSAVSFRWLATAVALGVYFVGSIGWLTSDGYARSAAWAVGFILGVSTCEALIASVYVLAVAELSDASGGIIGMFRSFMILSTTVLGLGRAWGVPKHAYGMLSGNDLLAFSAGCLFLWWWAALGTGIMMIRAREGAARRIVVLALIPTAAAVAVGVGGLGAVVAKVILLGV